MERTARTVAAIERGADMAVVRDAVRAHAAPLGYDRFVLYSASPAKDGILDHLYWVEGDWFGEGEAVDAATYVRRCPVTRHILETEDPFFWTKSGRKGVETYRVVASPRGSGLHGLQVPVFGRGGLRGAMSYGGRRIDASLPARLSLTLVATAAFARARRLLAFESEPAKPQLSAREQEVLRWVAAGRRQSEIALLLGLSDRTVENHLRRIRHRLGATTTAQAVLATVSPDEKRA